MVTEHPPALPVVPPGRLVRIRRRLVAGARLFTDPGSYRAAVGDRVAAPADTPGLHPAGLRPAAPRREPG